jgi:hypothetical protein
VKRFRVFVRRFIGSITKVDDTPTRSVEVESGWTKSSEVFTDENKISSLDWFEKYEECPFERQSTVRFYNP